MQIRNAKELLKRESSRTTPKLKTTISTLSPYYADIKLNRFAVLNPDDFTKFPYDTLVAAVTNEGEGSFCKSEIPVEDKDQLIVKELMLNVGKMRESPYDIYAVDSSLSAIYQALDYVIANSYYEKKYKNPLLGFILREKKKPPKYLGPHYYKKIAIDTLSRVLSSTDKKALATTTIRLLIELINKYIDPNTPRWQKWIASRKTRTPTYEQLVYAGISPDLKLKKYKSIFYQSEWDKLSQSGIDKLENEISEEQRKSVTPEALDHLIEWSGTTKERLQTSLCKKALLVRKKRLTVASRLRSGKRMLDDIVKVGIQNEGEKTYFAPFLIVSDGFNFSDAELFSKIKSVKNEKHFFFDEFEESVQAPLLITAAGLEFAKAISE